MSEHHEKLLKISKLTDSELQFSKEQIFSKIKFIDTRLLPLVILLQAETLVEQIDPDDTEHVALALFLECKLWSGDKKLRQGLLDKNQTWILNTDEMLDLRITLQA